MHTYGTADCQHNKLIDRSVCQTKMSVTCESEFKKHKYPYIQRSFLMENTICMRNVMQCAYKCTLLKLL